MWNWIADLPIRVKLGLLAGAPVVGAVALSLLVASDAWQKAAKAQALGSIESLAELSATMGELARELHTERARAALDLGLHAAAAKRGSSHTADGALKVQFARTDAALSRLEVFLRQLDTSKLPARLRTRLDQARHDIEKLRGARGRSVTALPLEDLMLSYKGALTALTGATAALSELTDDGEMLRVISSLVALLEVEERASQEHAILSYVFAVGDFPPGSYRELVTLLTEASTHEDVLRTNATRDQLELYEAANASPMVVEARRMRAIALEAAGEGFGVDPRHWFEVQIGRLKELERVDVELNRRVRTTAEAKQDQMRAAVSTGLGTAGAALLISLILGWVIGAGVSASVRTLTEASNRIARGDLTTRTAIATRDELGALGRAFDGMVAEIESSRQALNEKARMARELEIAASIQRSLLPPRPEHPDFEFAGRMVPADEVGGDFYDVLYDETVGNLWITIGDVSSHGLGAGLVMLMTQAAFAAHFRANPNAPPASVLQGVNSLLCEAVTQRLQDDKYVTAQLLGYVGGGIFQCAGGHQSPLLYRRALDRTEFIETPGPWLGILARLPEVSVTQVHLEPGDILCLYTDGIPEARSRDGELFDMAALEQAFVEAARAADDLDDIADRVLARVRAHTEIHDDDWTLLLVRRNEQALDIREGERRQPSPVRAAG